MNQEPGWKLITDWKLVVVFATVFIGIVALVALGKISPEYLGIPLAWISPSPFFPQLPKQDKNQE